MYSLYNCFIMCSCDYMRIILYTFVMIKPSEYMLRSLYSDMIIYSYCLMDEYIHEWTYKRMNIYTNT